MNEQLPAKERKGSVIEMLALDLAAEQAWEKRDYRLMAVATATWTLLGWWSTYLAEDIYVAPREEALRFQDYAVAHKDRRLLRAEARGFARCLALLESAGVLTERELSEARRQIWLRSDKPNAVEARKLGEARLAQEATG